MLNETNNKKTTDLTYGNQQNSIPSVITKLPPLPNSFTNTEPVKTYTIVVDAVPVRELLFSIARDSNLNLDIDNDIEGTISLNMYEQTLPQILSRISETLPIRYELNQRQLRIRKDDPYFKPYKIHYLNMARTSESTINVSTQISSTGSSTTDSTFGNNSQTSVTNTTDHMLWNTIIHNITLLISDSIENNEPSEDEESDSSVGSESSESESAENDEEDSEGGSEEEEAPRDIIISKESGIIMVRATQKKHQLVQAYIDEMLNSLQRQVLIEATIAEVVLSDHFQMGIDWSLLEPGSDSTVINLTQSLLGSNLEQAPFTSATYTDTIDSRNLDLTLKALQQFGNVKVVSSPKILVLNNQTALLKVVDNLVYYSIEVETTTDEGVTTIEYDTDINTVPVGFVMSVTPYIDEFEEITLNVRPTISRVVGTVQDPNPELAQVGVVNEAPIIQVREIESILKVGNGETAVLGGLMQNDTQKNTTGVPFLSKLPLIGSLFSYQNNETTKTELVIFINPKIITPPRQSNNFNIAEPFP